jgi:isoquinoline 1-oxidoreductase beta subunit
LRSAFRLPFGGPDVARAQDGSPEVGVWVAIGPDDTVNIRVVRSEMGQGTITGLAQLVADELECNWSKVRIEYPTPGESVKRKRAWGDFSTGGSRGIRESHEYVRKGGAAARLMLTQAAANQWKVPVAECSAANSVITHGPTKRRLRYGQVAEAAAKLPVPQDVKLKDPKEWKLIGKPIKRLDTADKVVGKTVYGIDVKLPGLLNAAIKDCPVFGGKVKSFDAAKVEGMRGVKKVVQVGDSAVAVVADTWWRAKTALDALPIVWDEGENVKVSSATIAEVLKAGLDAEQAFVGNQNGNAKEALAGAAKKVEAVYAYPVPEPRCMEPMNITVRYTPEKCEAWGPTQNGEGAFAAMLAASGLPADKVDVYKTMLGGGFGRRGAYPDDYVTQAVLIAKQMPGTPIKLLWSREEDMAHGRYHPVMQCKLVGGSTRAATSRGCTCASRAVDPRGGASGSGAGAEGPRPAQLPGRVRERRASVQLQRAEPADRPCDAQHARAAGLLARRQHQPERDLHRVLHGRARDAAGQDALEFRRKLLGKNPRGLAVLNAAPRRSAGANRRRAAGIAGSPC